MSNTNASPTCQSRWYQLGFKHGRSTTVSPLFRRDPDGRIWSNRDGEGPSWDNAQVIGAAYLRGYDEGSAAQ